MKYSSNKMECFSFESVDGWQMAKCIASYSQEDKGKAI